MYNWLTHLHKIMPRIIGKLLSGEDISRLIVAVVAAIAAYFLVGFATIPLRGYLTGEETDFNILLSVVSTVALITAVIVAWINFAHWLSDYDEQTDAEIIADAKINTNYRESSDDLSDHKNNPL